MGKNASNKWISVKILVFAAFAGTLAVNMMAVFLPLNGITTKEMSHLYPNLFTPAPYTFSIWTVIYIGLAGFAVYQFNPSSEGTEPLSPGDLLRIRFAFIFSCIVNSLWIYAWHYRQLGFTVILMILLLLTLIYVNDITKRNNFSMKENLFIKIPFGLYFGWITVAMISNITVFLVGAQWGHFGISPVLWTILLLAAGTAIASVAVVHNRNFAYAAAVLWAYGGILANHFSSDGFSGRYYSVMIVTVACMVVLLVVSVVRSLYRD